MCDHPRCTPCPDVRVPRCACSPWHAHSRLCCHTDVHPQQGMNTLLCPQICTLTWLCAYPDMVSPRYLCLSRYVLTWHTPAQKCALAHLCPPMQLCAHPDVHSPAAPLPSCALACPGPQRVCSSLLPREHRLSSALGSVQSPLGSTILVAFVSLFLIGFPFIVTEGGNN